MGLGDDSKELLVTGQVSQASDTRVDMTGMTVSWQFPGWVQKDGSWRVASPDNFIVECTGAVMPTRGEEEVCGDLGFPILNGKFTVAFGNVDLCPSCSVQGRNGGEEALIKIRHKDGLPLDIRSSQPAWGCYFDNSPVSAALTWTYSSEECVQFTEPVEQLCFGAGERSNSCCAPLLRVVGTTCMCTLQQTRFDTYSRIATEICEVSEASIVTGEACQGLLNDPKAALAALPPEEAAKYLLQIPRQVAAEAVSGMNPEDVAPVIELLSPAEAARILSNADPDSGANILGLMDPERAALVLQSIPPGHASDILAAMAVQDARQILEALPANVAPIVLQGMNPKDAAAIVAGLPPALAAEWLQEMPPAAAGNILKNIGPADSRRIVNRMKPVTLGNIVHAMGPDGVSVLKDIEDEMLRDVLSSLPVLVSSSIIELASSDEAADILERAHPATAAAIFTNLSPVKAAEILELMDADSAAAALNDMSVSSAAAVVQRLPPGKQQEILMRLPQE